MDQTPMEMGLPEGLEFTNYGTYLEFVRKWFSAATVVITVFAVFWDGFLVFWYMLVLQDGGHLMAILFPVLHILVGVGITYYAAASWVNRTRVLVSRQKIAIKHGPLPWFGAREIPAANVKQLYAKERVRRNRNSTNVTYGLNAITRDGKSIKLFTGFTDSDQVHFIEQEVEKYLRIEDVPVKHEHRG